MKIKKGSKRSVDVQALILTSELDFSADRICRELAAAGTAFLRLNREGLSELGLTLQPVEAALFCRKDACEWHVGDNLRSVWWRQGTFDRNIAGAGSSSEAQMERSQWAAFMRSIMVFDKPAWVNHPAKVYQAETKAVQLRQAALGGFDVPPTLMTNDHATDAESVTGADIALKSVDTLLLKEGAEQLFGYTTLTRWSDIATEDLSAAPATVQHAVADKLDLRVTVLGDSHWCVAIRNNGKAIDGDWRLTCKSDLDIRDYELPVNVSKRCVDLVRALGLRYGAIDLAFAEGRYWFIELNPIGEWGWLDSAERAISPRIASYLTCPH